jgi:hypothetical protein
MSMRRYEIWHRITRPAFRFAGLGAVAGIAAIAVPVAATASSHVADPYAHSSGAAGVFYGGLTSQGWAVVIQVTKNGRQVTSAATGLHMTCSTGVTANVPDRYARLRVNKRRKFSLSFGPDTVRNDDGTTTDFEGRISGAFNRARSKVSGRWRLQATDHDGTGAVIGTCDSGIVRWSARQ